MRIVCDIDGTIAYMIDRTKGETYSDARPIEANIGHLNRLYDLGHHIIIYTARGMATFKDAWKAKEAYESLTVKWLKDNGVKYHTLVMGKPSGDVYVDDLAAAPNILSSLK